MTGKRVLWGRKSSCNVQKVLWTLIEVGLPFDQIDVGGIHGGLDEPNYQALNPNGLVPTLQDGDLTIWESHAIVRYLAATYGQGPIWPADPRRRAQVDQWTDWTATTFQPAWIRLFWLLVRTPPEQRDAAAVAVAFDRAVAVMTILDHQLSERRFIAGVDFTYADIVAGVALYRWFTMPVDRPSMPGLEAWYARMQERPGFRQAVMVSYDDLVGRLDY